MLITQTTNSAYLDEEGHVTLTLRAKEHTRKLRPWANFESESKNQVVSKKWEEIANEGTKLGENLNNKSERSFMHRQVIIPTALTVLKQKQHRDELLVTKERQWMEDQLSGQRIVTELKKAANLAEIAKQTKKEVDSNYNSNAVDLVITNTLKAAEDLREAIRNKTDVLAKSQAALNQITLLNTTIGNAPFNDPKYKSIRDKIADSLELVQNTIATIDDSKNLANVFQGKTLNNGHTLFDLGKEPTVATEFDKLINEYNRLAAKLVTDRKPSEQARLQALQKYLLNPVLWNHVDEKENNVTYQAIQKFEPIVSGNLNHVKQNQHAEYLISLILRYNQLLDSNIPNVKNTAEYQMIYRKLYNAFFSLPQTVQSLFVGNWNNSNGCSKFNNGFETVIRANANGIVGNYANFYLDLATLAVDPSTGFDAILYNQAEDSMLDKMAKEIEERYLKPQFIKMQEARKKTDGNEKDEILAAFNESYLPGGVYDQFNKFMDLYKSYVIDSSTTSHADQILLKDMYKLYNDKDTWSFNVEPNFNANRSNSEKETFEKVARWRINQLYESELQKINDIDVSVNPHLEDIKNARIRELLLIVSEMQKLIRNPEAFRSVPIPSKETHEKAANEIKRVKELTGESVLESEGMIKTLFENMQLHVKENFNNQLDKNREQLKAKIKQLKPNGSAIQPLDLPKLEEKLWIATNLEHGRSLMQEVQKEEMAYLNKEYALARKKVAANSTELLNLKSQEMEHLEKQFEKELKSDAKLLRGVSLDPLIKDNDIFTIDKIDKNAALIRWVLFEPESVDDEMVNKLYELIHKSGILNHKTDFVDLTDKAEKEHLVELRKQHIREAILLEIRSGGVDKFADNYSDLANEKLEEVNASRLTIGTEITNAEKEHDIALALKTRDKGSLDRMGSAIYVLKQTQLDLTADIGNLKGITAENTGIWTKAENAVIGVDQLVWDRKTAEDRKDALVPKIRLLGELLPDRYGHIQNFNLNQFPENDNDLNSLREPAQQWKDAVKSARDSAFALHNEVCDLFLLLQLRQNNTQPVKDRIITATLLQADYALAAGLIDKTTRNLITEASIAREINDGRYDAATPLEIMGKLYGDSPLNSSNPTQISTIEQIRTHHHTWDFRDSALALHQEVCDLFLLRTKILEQDEETDISKINNRIVAATLMQADYALAAGLIDQTARDQITERSILEQIGNRNTYNILRPLQQLQGKYGEHPPLNSMLNITYDNTSIEAICNHHQTNNLSQDLRGDHPQSQKLTLFPIAAVNIAKQNFTLALHNKKIQLNQDKTNQERTFNVKTNQTNQSRDLVVSYLQQCADYFKNAADHLTAFKNALDAEKREIKQTIAAIKNDEHVLHKLSKQERKNYKTKLRERKIAIKAILAEGDPSLEYQVTLVNNVKREFDHKIQEVQGQNQPWNGELPSQPVNLTVHIKAVKTRLKAIPDQILALERAKQPIAEGFPQIAQNESSTRNKYDDLIAQQKQLALDFEVLTAETDPHETTGKKGRDIPDDRKVNMDSYLAEKKIVKVAGEQVRRLITYGDEKLELSNATARLKSGMSEAEKNKKALMEKKQKGSLELASDPYKKFRDNAPIILDTRAEFSHKVQREALFDGKATAVMTKNGDVFKLDLKVKFWETENSIIARVFTAIETFVNRYGLYVDDAQQQNILSLSGLSVNGKQGEKMGVVIKALIDELYKNPDPTKKPALTVENLYSLEHVTNDERKELVEKVQSTIAKYKNDMSNDTSETAKKLLSPSK